MEFDKKNMTLEEAIAIIKEIEPQHESTNSGTAEGVILQAVHDSEIVPVVRCQDCAHCVSDCNSDDSAKCVINADYDELLDDWFGFVSYHNQDFFCADGERRESAE